jgi:neutral ceramidase
MTRFCLALFVMLHSAPLVASTELRVGCAAVDITPEAGTPMQAPQRPPYEIKLATSPHDPLHVKAVVLAVGEQKAALVVCDLASIPVALIEAARQQIAATTDLDPLTVMISATHTHTAPQIRPRFITRADEPTRAKTTAYIESLPRKIADAVRRANERLKPAHAAVAIGREETVSFNRRYRMANGSVQTSPGKTDAAIVRNILGADGPIDPEVGVVTFETADGQALATLIDFAIHLDTIGGSEPSADFPFQIAATLASVRGPEMLTVFAPGAAGNINHYDLLDPTRIHRMKGVPEATRIGTILAAEVLRCYRRLTPILATDLRIAREVVRLDMPAEKGQAFAARYEGATQFFDGELMVFNKGGKQQFDAEVQVIALGDDLAWVGFPGEMFVEHGLALKNASPFRYTMIHTLANGSIGYVPNRKAYGHGAYEDTATRCAPGEGEKLVDVATQLLAKLKRPQSP